MERKGNNLRVVLLSSYSLDSNRIHGGVQGAVAYLVRGLARIEDLELHVLTMRPAAWIGPDNFDQNNVCVHLMPPYRRFERLRDYHSYQSILDDVLAQIQPAVVHAQEAAADSFVALRSGFPTVVTAHGIRAEDARYVRSWFRRLHFIFDSMLTERRVMRRVRYLISICRYVTTYFGPLLRSDIHIEYIPNAVDESFFDLGRHDSSKPVILYAGRVIPRKRAHDLVFAFAQIALKVHQAELRIAGETESDSVYVKTVKDYIKQVGLSERVHFLGELQENELLREYRSCTLVVLPSSQETTPMVLAQAMAAGKPVVATRVGGVSEMVGQENERGILINVGDVDALAAAISHLLQNPAQCESLGRAARNFALENYHLDRVAQRTYEVYREIASLESQNHG